MDNTKILPGLTKIFFGLIYRNLEQCEKTIELIKSLAPIDIESNEIPFDFTDYYNEEFGSLLKRKWVSIDKKIPENELVHFKQTSIEWEKELAIDNKRTVNCDPGGISESKVVLVTTKNYSHRIYIGNGIYGEVTLIYKNKTFKPLEWTYPDYQSETFIQFALKCREKLKSP